MSESTLTTTPLVSELSSEPDMIELIEMFVQELPNRVNALRDSIEAQDLQTLGRLTHQLKGAAGGYGFPTITTAAADLEKAIKATQDLEKINAELEALANLCNRARAQGDKPRTA